jgi:hypothetical protein
MASDRWQVCEVFASLLDSFLQFFPIFNYLFAITQINPPHAAKPQNHIRRTLYQETW